MGKDALLSRQTVTRKQVYRRPFLRDLLRFVTSVSFKVLILIAGMISVSLMFLYGYKGLTSSSYFKLEYVQVSGVDDEIKRELIKLAGLNENVSLLTINLNEIKAKMEKHPWVRTVELEKRFPHTLVINTEKQSPRALVLFDRLFYMNRWGKVFKEIDSDDSTDFPVITGVSGTDEDSGKKLKMAAGILDDLESETGLLSINDISEIHVNDGGDALIYPISVPVAIRVTDESLKDGKTRLKRLVRYLQNSSVIETVKVIDMDYLDGAVVSFKEPESLAATEKEGGRTVGL